MLWSSIATKAQFFTDLTNWITPTYAQSQEDQFFENWSQGKQDSIEYYLSIFILCEPENQLYHYWLGRAHIAAMSMQNPSSPDDIKSKYFHKAKAQFMLLENLDSTSYLPHYAMGMIHWKKAVLTSKIWIPYHYSRKDRDLIGKMMVFMKKEFNEALPYFQKAEKLNPNHIPTLARLSELYARLDDFGMVKRLKRRIEAIKNEEVFEASIFD